MKKESWIILVISLIVLIGLGSYAYFSNTGFSFMKAKVEGDSRVVVPIDSSNKMEESNIVNVSIKDFAFAPKSINIKAGDSVVWTNNDSMSHSIVVGNIVSPEIRSNATFIYKFKDKGTFIYNCGIHPKMVGEIVVE